MTAGGEGADRAPSHRRDLTGHRSLGEQVGALARRVFGAGDVRGEALRRHWPAVPPARPQADQVDEPAADCDHPWHSASTPDGEAVEPTCPACGDSAYAGPRPVDAAAAYLVLDDRRDDGDGWRVLAVRAYAAGVSDMIAALAQLAPARPDRFGEVNATTSLTLAVVALRLAAEQAQPTEHASLYVDPAQLRSLIGTIAQAQHALGKVVDAAQAQLGCLYTAASEYEIGAPPGATPTAEVLKIITSLIDAGTRAALDTAACASAADRLGRLHRVTPPGSQTGAHPVDSPPGSAAAGDT